MSNQYQVLLIQASSEGNSEFFEAASELDWDYTSIDCPTELASMVGDFSFAVLLVQGLQAKDVAVKGAQLQEQRPRLPQIYIGVEGEEAVLAAYRHGAHGVIGPSLSALELSTRLDVLTEMMVQNHALVEENLRLTKINHRMKKYVGNVAHDLRGPLGKLINTSEVLLSGAELDSLDSLYQIIARTSRRGFDLVNNILDISALESGNFHINMQPCNLSDIADQVVTELNYLASEKDISLRNRVLMPMIVEADEQRLLQVLGNLVSNAVKFTPRFGTVTLQAKPGEGGIRVEVVDSGIGMTPEQTRDVFNLTDIKKSTPGTEGERGTGLGLAIAQEIIQAHGSSIKVRSKQGEGSTFSFMLPTSA